jgi:mannosyltransferase
VGVFMLARQVGLRWPLLAVALYAASPMTLRYALEARPYAQAACWSVFASVVFLSLVRQPSAAKAAGYAALIAAGLYTQPYSVFVPVAHLVWIAIVSPKSRSLWFAVAAAGAAALAFVPWFVKTHAAWRGALDAGVRFNVNARDLLVIPHELMGTGYGGAALAGIAILVALATSSLQAEKKLFLSLYVILPLVLVPAADAYFGYFLAARQMIFALVPIGILIAACSSVRWGWILPVAMLGAMLYEDVRWARRPGEGWQAAAALLKDAGCTIFMPSGARTMYAYFEPRLSVCNENALAPVESIALAVSPDQPASALVEAHQKLSRAGFRKAADLRTADPRIELYRK